MEFCINWQTNHNKVQEPTMSVGIKGLDRARAFLGLPELDSGLIHASYGKNINAYIIVPEVIARASGMFEEQNRITVYIPCHAIVSFCDEVYNVNQDAKTGEVKNVQLVWALNTERFLEFWADNGYFKSWEIDDKGNIFDGMSL